MYRSTATLTPNGTVMLAGSNPNNDVNQDRDYKTEYRVEFYSPPYITQPHSTYTGRPATVDLGSIFTLSVTLRSGVRDVSVWAMDLGSVTHGVHMDTRAVKLSSILLPGGILTDKRRILVAGPPSGGIFPPGPAFIYVVTDAGVPSFGHKAIIGTGASPPANQVAIDK
ncbi:copper radical oxidase [Moniliophthora roreri MCA 2997]|uniref:Copper radical oxidase n=2 Tax=Moniliophthora roreri TaxID=221103 RepID=V2WW50_MONRO|nr:copper radical oxidase [Moniliophthora roreri MCA 2997]KAI3613142.1 copper radical oxidase [Moniliophthora roreri]